MLAIGMTLGLGAVAVAERQAKPQAQTAGLGQQLKPLRIALRELELDHATALRQLRGWDSNTPADQMYPGEEGTLGRRVVDIGTDVRDISSRVSIIERQTAGISPIRQRVDSIYYATR